MKRFVLLMLALCMTAMCAVSCADGKTDDDNSATDNNTQGNAPDGTTAPAVTDVKKVSDDIGDVDIKGFEFRILAYKNDFTHGANISHVPSADTINDAQFEMTQTLMNRFGIEMTERLTDSTEVNTDSKVWIESKEDNYEVIVVLDRVGCSWAQQGLVTYYDKLPYVDLEKPYWDSSINESTSIAGKYFIAAGAANLTVYDYTHLLTFNKQMIKDYSLDSPYELVNTGTWTFSKFHSMMTQVTNSSDGTWDENDTYGFVTAGKQILPNMWIAADLLTVEKDNDDIPSFTVDGNEKFQAVYETVMNYMHTEHNWFGNNDDGTWYLKNTLFQDKKALFAGHTFFTVEYLRGTDVEFGLLPYPKWRNAQEKYLTRVEGGVRMMTVPVTNKNLEKTSIVMEAMMCEAYNTVIPAYYDIILKSKTATDDVSADMIDIILANRVYDLGDTYWYSDIRKTIFTTLFSAKGSTSYTAAVKNYSGKVNTSILEAVDKINYNG